MVALATTTTTTTNNNHNPDVLNCVTEEFILKSEWRSTGWQIQHIQEEVNAA